MGEILDDPHRAVRLLKVHADYGLNDRDGDPGVVDLEWLEVGTSRRRKAEQYPDGSFTILAATGKLLQPFLENATYQSIDELAERLVNEGGATLTDLRRPLGFVDNVEEACKLMEHDKLIIEHQYRWSMLMAPRVDGRHGDFWFVDDDVFRCMTDTGLIHLVSKRNQSEYFKNVYLPGPRKFDDTFPLPSNGAPRSKSDVALVEGGSSGFSSGLLAPTRYKRKTSPSPPTRSIPARGLPAIGVGPRKAMSSLSEVLAYDDDGGLITGLDLQKEFRKRAPRGLPKDLMPVADPDVSDEEWEKLMLIEQIKFRRRTGQ